MEIDEEKMRFNLEAKSSMREYLRSKSWVEKVESIERMNEADRTAKTAMKQTLEELKAKAGG